MVLGGTQKLLVCSLFLVMLTGCIGLIPSPFRPSPGPQKVPQLEDLQEAFDIVCRNYRLGASDELTILYQAEWTLPTGTYRLDTLDKIRVKFLFDPELNEDVVIAPDGMITLQGIGEMQAAGLTRQELADRIEQRLIELRIFTPEKMGPGLPGYRMVTVHLIEFYGKVNRLVDALRGLTGGTQQTMKIKPDGTIDMPMVAEPVLCAGYTIKEVENTINRLYKRTILKGVTACVTLRSANSKQFYALGEVGGPGAYAIDQPITALHAIAMAGGYKADSADLTSVILISRDIHGRPIGRRLDLKKIFDIGDLGANIMIKPYDVIFIPKTYISDVNTFMGQYLSVISGVNSLVRSLGPSGGTTSP